MNTILADSGYIRLSDDKRFLLVTLFHGETYEQTRNSQWFTKSALRHHIFDLQKHPGRHHSRGLRSHRLILPTKNRERGKPFSRFSDRRPFLSHY